MEVAEKSPLISAKSDSNHKRKYFITIIILLLSLIIVITGIVLYFFVFNTESTSSDDIFIPYKYTFNRTHIISPLNNTKIAISLSTPIPKTENEKFPVLFNYKPYRKDGKSYFRDWQFFDYFSKYGFIVCMADIRGTGSSHGIRIQREYTKEEMIDGQYIIEWLALNYSYSNGNVGMFGISWGGINPLILAMLQTPHLKTILVFHASDDLYYNDIHYINGVKHLDEYITHIDHDTALPSSEYSPFILDEQFYFERFNQTPWIIEYFTQQTDSEFWTNYSVLFHVDKLIESNISFYLWSGQLDGYKDYAYNLYSKMKNNSNTSCKIVMGPWDHEYSTETFAENVRVEWKYQAVRWFNVYLRDKYDNNILNEPDVTIYVRHYASPTMNATDIPGEWRTYNTLPNITYYKLYLNNNNQLSTSINHSDNNTNITAHSLLYRAMTGTEIPIWWGGRTGNMYDFDTKYSLVYDSEILTEMIEIIGKPTISIRVKSSALLANWIVRLEDFNPVTNESVLITGSNRNGAQRESRINPSYIPIDEWFILKWDLHYATWQFPENHKIRIAITNSLYSMLWPSKYKMNTSLNVNHFDTFIDLPVSNVYGNNIIINGKQPAFISDPIETHPNPINNINACYYNASYGTDDYYNGRNVNISFDINNNMIAKTSQSGYSCVFVENRNQCWYWQYSFEGNENVPEINTFKSLVRSYFLFNNPMPQVIIFNNTPICYLNNSNVLQPQFPDHVENASNNSLDLWTLTTITSDLDNFYININRTLYQNSVFQQQRIFEETIPRVFQ
eukprot:251203_1